MKIEQLRIWAVEQAIQALSGHKPYPSEVARYAEQLIAYVQNGEEPDA